MNAPQEGGGQGRRAPVSHTSSATQMHSPLSCQILLIKHKFRNTPGGPVVKNLPSSARDMGSVPGGGTKIPHAAGKLSQWTANEEPTSHNKDPAYPKEKNIYNLKHCL